MGTFQVKKTIFARALFILFSSCSTTNFSFPDNAEIEVEKVFSKDEDLQACAQEIKAQKMSNASGVLKAFRTYNVIDAKTMHDKYIWSECMVVGTIIHNRKIFKWKWRVGNLLETDFPDGVPKILGGEYTDGEE